MPRRIKGSSFAFHDQGIFYSLIDFGGRITNNAAQNNACITTALAAMNAAGGGVLIIPHGIIHSFNPATGFPVTANALMVLQFTGNKFVLDSNQSITSDFGDILGQMFLTLPSAVSYRIVDANPATHTYKFEVYNNAGVPVITGSSFDLCFFLPGGVNPIAAFARGGTKPGALYLFAGATFTGGVVDITGGLSVDSLKVAGQTQNSKSIQAPATGTTINWDNATQYLVLNHAATIAALTINLPTAPLDGHVIKLYARSIVTALTLTPGAGKSVAAGHTITTIAALTSIEYIYNVADTSWYRVR